MAYHAAWMVLSIARPEVEGELLHALDQSPFLVLAGPRGSGKTTVLKRIASRWRGPTAIAQLESIACSPEVLRDELHRIAEPVLGPLPPSDAPLTSLATALEKRPPGSLLLLDDLTELRTLAYYPSVERPLETVLDALSRSKAPVIATTRFRYWIAHHFPELVIHLLPPLTARELSDAGIPSPELIVAVTRGLAVHVAHLATGDVAGTLAHELQPGGAIETECRATMSDLLHRARGYGACKWVLRVLADEEPLTLTEVARRLDRTPGSTRDYLRWLEEVDLIASENKRYSYVDPILRLWVRIYGRGTPATEDGVRREAHEYVESRVMRPDEDAEPFAFPPPPSEDLVEFD